MPKLRRTLQLGVTTVRDAWGADAGLRDAIDAGHVTGPRLLVSLAQLCGTGGIGDHFRPDIGEYHGAVGSPHLPRGVFDGPMQARNAVRRMVRSGADIIKVTATRSMTRPQTADLQQVADDEMAEIVAEAARADRHVMVHAHGARAAEAAARAGARSIEHGADWTKRRPPYLLRPGRGWSPPCCPAKPARTPGRTGSPESSRRQPRRSGGRCRPASRSRSVARSRASTAWTDALPGCARTATSCRPATEDDRHLALPLT